MKAFKALQEKKAAAKAAAEAAAAEAAAASTVATATAGDSDTQEIETTEAVVDKRGDASHQPFESESTALDEQNESRRVRDEQLAHEKAAIEAQQEQLRKQAELDAAAAAAAAEAAAAEAAAATAAATIAPSVAPASSSASVLAAALAAAPPAPSPSKRRWSISKSPEPFQPPPPNSLDFIQEQQAALAEGSSNNNNNNNNGANATNNFAGMDETQLLLAVRGEIRSAFRVQQKTNKDAHDALLVSLEKRLDHDKQKSTVLIEAVDRRIRASFDCYDEISQEYTQEVDKLKEMLRRLSDRIDVMERRSAGTAGNTSALDLVLAATQKTQESVELIQTSMESSMAAMRDNLEKQRVADRREMLALIEESHTIATRLSKDHEENFLLTQSEVEDLKRRLFLAEQQTYDAKKEAQRLQHKYDDLLASTTTTTSLPSSSTFSASSSSSLPHGSRLFSSSSTGSSSRPTSSRLGGGQ